MVSLSMVGFKTQQHSAESHILHKEHGHSKYSILKIDQDICWHAPCRPGRPIKQDKPVEFLFSKTYRDGRAICPYQFPRSYHYSYRCLATDSSFLPDAVQFHPVIDL